MSDTKRMPESVATDETPRLRQQLMPETCRTCGAWADIKSRIRLVREDWLMTTRDGTHYYAENTIGVFCDRWCLDAAEKEGA